MSSNFKIYTRTGDKGMTSLIGGKRVSKSDLQVEAYGNIDEAKSYIALLMDLIETENIKEDLKTVIIKLFVVESIVAAINQESAEKMPQLEEYDIQYLENKIDEMDNEMPPLTAFVLPGGNLVNSHCHIARTICRRAERATLRLWDHKPELYNSLVEKYLNRLSDYLFTLSRYYSIKNNIPETLWISK